jgi:ribosomal protein S18 acetylase RimI-like enzyme
MNSTPCLEQVAVRLDDGRSVDITPLRSVHAQTFTTFLEEMSHDDRRRRFMQAMPLISPRLVTQLIDVDHCSHVAWMAMVGSRAVAEVRYVRSPASSSAEIAFAVDADFRRVGLGRRLVEAVGVVARSEGLDTFTAMVAPDNRPSVSMLTSLGTKLRFDSGSLEGGGPIPEWQGPPQVAADILELHACHRAELGMAA